MCSVLCAYLFSSDSFPDSDTVSGQTSRDTGVSSNGDTPTNLGIPEFPAANSEEGLYYQNVLLAVERWFSLFGWPSGPHPISIPHTLRRYGNFPIVQLRSHIGRLVYVRGLPLLGTSSIVTYASSLLPELCQKFKRIIPVDGLIESVKVKTPGVYTRKEFSVHILADK